MMRQPVVSGSFYPSDLVELKVMVERFLSCETVKVNARAVIVPHAGYIYSGAVAGEVFARVNIPENIILLGPNHHGAGADIAVSAAEAWNTPLGDVQVDETLKHELLRQLPDLREDESSHRHEHSLEVMLPFLQCCQPKCRIVPISLGRLSYPECVELSSGISSVLKSRDDTLILASTDMNHFSTAAVSERLDALATDAMTAFDPEELYRVVTENNISMCGVLPVVTALLATRSLGAGGCQLIRYAHSGLVNGDNSRVVGYAGLVIQ